MGSPGRRFKTWCLADEFLVGDGCWEWRNDPDAYGYGRVMINGRRQKAHRAIYEWLRGPIPEGLTLDHLCRNKICVRPAHLEPVTAAENARRAQLGTSRADRPRLNGGRFVSTTPGAPDGV